MPASGIRFALVTRVNVIIINTFISFAKEVMFADVINLHEKDDFNVILRV